MDVPKDKAEKGSHSERRTIPMMMIHTAGKLLESTICRTLYAFLGEERLTDCQFGFRKARSTMDTLEMVMATAGKLLERIICRRLKAFLGEESLSDRQCGYRKSR